MRSLAIKILTRQLRRGAAVIVYRIVCPDHLLLMGSAIVPKAAFFFLKFHIFIREDSEELFIRFLIVGCANDFGE